MESCIKLLSDLSDLSDLDIELLNLSCKELSGILDLDKYKKLTKLTCDCNEITLLTNLSSQLIELNCERNSIVLLDNLPPKLKELNCKRNKLTNLDTPKIYLISLNKFWVRTRNLTCVKFLGCNLPSSLEKISLVTNKKDFEFIDFSNKYVKFERIKLAELYKIANQNFI